jgi:hypothetical protein
MQFDPIVFDKLRVPPERRDHATEGLILAIFGARIAYALRRDQATIEEAKRQLARAATALKAARHEVGRFGTTARHWFDSTADRLDIGIAGNRGPYENLLAALDENANIAGDPSHFVEHYDGSPDHRVYSPTPSPFDLLVCLLWMVARTQRWHLTITPENHSGTLLEIFPLLAPHLPADLIPRALDLKRLQRLRTSARALASSVSKVAGTKMDSN